MNHIKLNSEDTEILNNFMDLVEGSACEKRAKNIKTIMLIIYDVSGVGYNEWDLETLRKFMVLLNKSGKPNSTTNGIKKTLRRFLREHYEDWDKRFKGFRDEGAKTKKENNEDKINKKVLIKPEEVELLLKDKNANFLYQAWLVSALETGARISELLTTRWKDWDLENKEVQIRSTKNETTRTIQIQDCVYYLKQHKQNYPYKDLTEEDYVFPSPTDRNKHLSLATLYNFFSRITEKILGRKLKPYICRHTRLSYLMNVAKLTPKVYEAIADHSYELGISTYSHIDNGDIEKEMRKVLNKKELTKEEAGEMKLVKQICTTLLEANIQLGESQLKGDNVEEFAKETYQNFIASQKVLLNKIKK